MTLTLSRVANLAARAIDSAYSSYRSEFDAITHRASRRFNRREWVDLQADSTKRLGLYTRVVDRLLSEVRSLLGDRIDDRVMWVSIKAVYSGLVAGRHDWELAETFFNSVSRRVFCTVGVDPDVEFVASDYDTPPVPASESVYEACEGEDVTAMVRAALAGAEVGLGDALERELATVMGVVTSRVGDRVVRRVEMVRPVFYRAMGAYRVGRLVLDGGYVPLVVAYRNQGQGPAVDAVLTEEKDVSILFSYTRAYFHVETPRPSDLVRFLKTIMPRKRVAELYIAIGHNKHGKTELYRDLLGHLGASDERFIHAPGVPGMVMAAFTLPNYDLIVKVIRDRFPPPKSTTRRAVMDKYRLVFKHDRAGRLIDAQEFEHLRFPARLFESSLLEELTTSASRAVRMEGDQVVIEHAYLERRVTPLDVYLRQADGEEAARAVTDYGRAIKDLAATNIFPGDMLIKNFGVTRSGRVVFYDYDELTLLSECRFRALPEPVHDDDLMSDAPWFGVGEHDIFPEEFTKFLGMRPALRARFEHEHADLFDPATWSSVQQRLANGEFIEVLPYRSEVRV